MHNNQSIQLFVISAADFISTIIKHITPYSHKQTPLAIACKFGHITTAKLLLAYGADPDIQDEEGETPLHLAARGGFEGCVRLLVGLDIDVEVPDGSIKNILKSSNLKKANIEIKENFYGWTPLFLASKILYLKFIEQTRINGK
jgi:glycerophosphodiester phosphodiesterase